jgi:uncharacterized protein YjiK
MSTTRIFSPRSGAGRLVLLCLFVVSGACSTTSIEPGGTGSVLATQWDVEDFEIYEWSSDVPEFEPGFALEGSGLAMSAGALFLASEKYASVLHLSVGNPTAASVLRLRVPKHSELEGMAYHDGRLLLCDEAHAAVYEVELPNEIDLHGEQNELEVKKLALPELGVQGGKIGLEGLAVDPATGTIFLLLERSGDPDSGCHSTVFVLSRDQDELETTAPAMEIELDDCSWRLTGLHFDNGRLLALETSYPGFEYRILSIDPEDGSHRVLQDITELSRSLAKRGYDNNLEGLVLASDGDLYLVSDNEVTGVIDAELPPPCERKTLLLRLKPTQGAS